MFKKIVFTILLIVLCASTVNVEAISKPSKKYNCDGTVTVKRTIKRGDQKAGKPLQMEFISDYYDSGTITLGGETFDITKKYMVDDSPGIGTVFTDSNGEEYELFMIRLTESAPIPPERQTDSDRLEWTTTYEVIHNHHYGNFVEEKGSFTKNGIIQEKCGKCDLLKDTYIIPKLDDDAFGLAKNKYVYTGKAIKPGFRCNSEYINILNGRHMIVSYKNNVNAGTGTVEVLFSEGHLYYEGAKKFSFTIAKALSKMKVTAKSVTSRKAKIPAKKYIKATNNAGKVTYSKKTGSSMIKVDSKSGDITVNKKAKKGKYRISVKVADSGSKNYNPKSITKTITVTIA